MNEEKTYDTLSVDELKEMCKDMISKRDHVNDPKVIIFKTKRKTIVWARCSLLTSYDIYSNWAMLIINSITKKL